MEKSGEREDLDFDTSIQLDISKYTKRWRRAAHPERPFSPAMSGGSRKLKECRDYALVESRIKKRLYSIQKNVIAPAYC